MFHYREVIERLRRSEGRRLIQAALQMGPRKIDEIRRLAKEKGWLDASVELPTDEEVMAAVAQAESHPKPRSQRSSPSES